MTDQGGAPPNPGAVSVSESGPVAVGGDVAITGAIAAGRDVVIERLSVIADDWAPAGDAATRPGAPTDVCPYPGIQPFSSDQRAWFAGRDRDVGAVLDHLVRADFVAVIGGSGSGKSSLLAAGIGPGFVDAGAAAGVAWTVRPLRPGPTPATLLRSHLEHPTPADSATPPTLWLIDQLEEAFARGVTDDERRAFLDGLGEIAAGRHGPAKVVVALRSDFYPALDAHRGIADAVAADQHRLLPLDAESMRDVILRPAELVGLRVEPALVDQVLADLDPGTNQLPLLAYAMRETWRRRRNGWLTLAGYVDAGGVGQALENGATAVWNELSDEQRDTARRVFLRLTSVGEGRAATRQRVDVEDLVTDRDDLDSVVDVLERFTRQRLVVPDQDEHGKPTVDIAHEALLREWSVLHGWLDEDLDTRRLQRQLSDAARQWDEGGRGPTGLLAGRRLQAVQEARRAGDITVNDMERAFVRTSEVRAARDRRRSVLLLAFFVALVAALVVVGLVWAQQRQTARQRDVADALQLSAQARGLIDDRRDQAALLSIAAWRADDSVSTLGSLIDAVNDAAGPLAYPVPAGTVTALASALTYDGSATLGLGDGTVRLIDPLTGQERSRIETGMRAVADVAVASDDTMVVGGTFGEVAVVPGGSGAVTRLTGATSTIVAVRFDPASGIVVAGTPDGTLSRWRIDGNSIEALPAIELGSPLLAMELDTTSGDDALVVAATGNGTLHRVELVTGRPLDPLDGGFDGERGALLAAADAGMLVSDGSGFTVWDLAAGRPIATSGGDRPITALTVVGDVAFSGSPSGAVQAWMLSPVPVAIGPARDGLGTALTAVATDGRTVVGLGTEAPPGERLVAQLVAWDADARRVPGGSTLAERDDAVRVVAVSARGDVATATATELRVLTPAGTDRLLPGHPGTTGLAWRDATTLAVGTETGAVDAIDMADGTISTLAPAGDSPIVEVVAADDGTVAFVTEDGDITVLDDDGPRVLAVPELENESCSSVGCPVTSLALAPDGRSVAVGIDARGASVAFVWDLRRDDADPVVLAGHTRKVTSIAFSPGGDLLATGSDDRSVRLWSLPEGDAVATLDGHSDLVDALVFSADGDQLLSGGEDATLRVWDVATGERLGDPWQWPGAIITSIAPSSDGRSVVVAHGTTIVRWAFGVDGWIADACALAGRELAVSEWARLAPNHEPLTLCPAQS